MNTSINQAVGQFVNGKTDEQKNVNEWIYYFLIKDQLISNLLLNDPQTNK